MVGFFNKDDEGNYGTAEKDGSANSDNTVKSNEQASGFEQTQDGKSSGFTGGDPLIQHEAVAKMAEFAQSKNVPTYLESSCFDAERFSHVLPFIDIVKIEFKTVESGFVPPEQHPKLFAQALECLTRSISASKKTYVKIVVSSKTNLADFESMLADIFANKAALKILGLIIQPTHGIAEPKLPLLMQMYDAAAKYHSTIRVMPQMHKVIGAP